MNILIADDSAFMREVLTDLVQSVSSNAVITHAQDGEDALKKCEEITPDLILLDLIMPGKTGIEVLEEIGSKVTVIVISATGESTMVDKAKALGAKDFILKPFDEEKVKAAIQKYLSSS